MDKITLLRRTLDMSCSLWSVSQHGSSTATPTELSSERETNVTPALNHEESRCEQRAQSSSSLSSSSSSSTCSKEEKVEMTCAVKDCNKSAFKSRRYRLLPWKCKYHRNKTYKETYRKRKAMANQDLFNCDLRTPSHDPRGDRQGLASRQRLGQQGSMLEEVLNEKKMALMQSPVVLDFLQKQQEKKHQQQKHQQKQWGLPQVRGCGQPSHR